MTTKLTISTRVVNILRKTAYFPQCNRIHQIQKMFQIMAIWLPCCYSWRVVTWMLNSIPKHEDIVKQPGALHPGNLCHRPSNPLTTVLISKTCITVFSVSTWRHGTKIRMSKTAGPFPNKSHWMLKRTRVPSFCGGTPTNDPAFSIHCPQIHPTRIYRFARVNDTHPGAANWNNSMKRYCKTFENCVTFHQQQNNIRTLVLRKKFPTIGLP